MPTIVVCYKWVLDEADIKIKADLSVDFSRARGKISDYDRNAIEAAVQMAKLTGWKAVGMTFGNKKTKQSLKDALSRGLEEAHWVIANEGENIDNKVTAKALAAALQTLDDVRMVICADGASDTFSRQTAPRIAAIMDLPVITSVSKMSVEGNTLTAVRKLEDCLETVQVDFPAVVAVLPEIYQPTIPGLKAVMAAGKKPVREYDFRDLSVEWSTNREHLEVRGFSQQRKNILIEGEEEHQVLELITSLKKEGVL